MSPRCSAIRLNVVLKHDIHRIEVNLMSRLDPELFEYLYGPREGRLDLCPICMDYPQQVFFSDCARPHPVCHHCARFLKKRCPLCNVPVGLVRHLPRHEGQGRSFGSLRVIMYYARECKKKKCFDQTFFFINRSRSRGLLRAD
jgi:Zinc finger, C3HC4 type (RING finger)